jgi:flagellar hook-length control protein FliK
VPHVASEATKHAFKPALANPARAAQSSARAPSSPFESLLDDGTQAITAQPAPSPKSVDKTERTKRPDSAQALAKAKDDKAAKPGDDTNAGTTAETGAKASDGKATADGKTTDGKTTDGKTGTPAAAGDDAKPASDGKPADGAASAALAADAANNPVETIAPVAVATTAPNVVSATAPGTVPQAAPAADQAAIVAAEAPKIDAPKADASKTKAVELAAAQADADKTAAAHPHDEAPVNTHHAATETPPPIAAEPQAAAPKAPTDAAQQASLTPQAQDASPTPANPAAPATQATAQAAAVPLAGVAIEIANKALDGKNHFEIRLDPPELGRIEVRLDVDRDGHVTSRLIADRSDTLDLLRRDASGLERALQDAGLKTADNSLQFSLRDQSMSREQSNTPTPGAAQIVVSDDALPVTDPSPRNYSRLAGLGGGIDIRV